MTPNEIELKLQEIENNFKNDDFSWRDYTNFIFSISDNKNYIFRIIKCDVGFFHGCDKAIKNDREVCEHILTEAGYMLEGMEPGIKDNKELVSIAIEKWPLAFKYASERLKDDEDIVTLTFETFIKDGNPDSLMIHVSDRLKNDLKFMEKIISISPYCFTGAGDKVRDDNQLFLNSYETAENKKYMLMYASKRIRDLCGNNDPATIIKSEILKNELSENLTENSQRKKKNKI